ncbi:LuxR family transcriptional regulator [Rhodohalobacter sp. SW132]|nr:LuxR family transcriptional regulator [Rhodohalobacter sp. SW132]
MVVSQKLNIAIFGDFARPGTYSFAYHIKKPGGEWISVKHEIYHKRYAEKRIALNLLYDNTERELINSYLDISQPNDSGADGNGVANDVTDREKQVLKLIACGLSSKQIAKKLYLSQHTVVSHRKNLIKKFRVKNTAELIKKASKIISL